MVLYFGFEACFHSTVLAEETRSDVERVLLLFSFRFKLLFYEAVADLVGVLK